MYKRQFHVDICTHLSGTFNGTKKTFGFRRFIIMGVGGTLHFDIVYSFQVKTADKDVDFSCKLSGSDKDKFKAASALGLFIYFLLKFLIF